MHYQNKINNGTCEVTATHIIYQNKLNYGARKASSSVDNLTKQNKLGTNEVNDGVYNL